MAVQDWAQHVRLRAADGRWVSDKLDVQQLRTGGLRCNIPWYVSSVSAEALEGVPLAVSRHCEGRRRLDSLTSVQAANLAVGENWVWLVPVGGQEAASSCTRPLFVLVVRGEPVSSLGISRTMTPHEVALTSFWIVFLMMCVIKTQGAWSRMGCMASTVIAIVILSRIGLDTIQTAAALLRRLYSKVEEMLAEHIGRERARWALPAALVGGPVLTVLLVLVIWYVVLCILSLCTFLHSIAVGIASWWTGIWQQAPVPAVATIEHDVPIKLFEPNASLAEPVLDDDDEESTGQVSKGPPKQFKRLSTCILPGSVKFTEPSGRVVNSESASACQLACREIEDCKHFSWNSVDKMCHLFGEYVSVHLVAGSEWLSGPSDCVEGFVDEDSLVLTDDAGSWGDSVAHPMADIAPTAVVQLELAQVVSETDDVIAEDDGVEADSHLENFTSQEDEEPVVIEGSPYIVLVVLIVIMILASL
mmetsp:Transcript_4375/g.7516  ORF Transcript_4375/g.7516 Transcript_4375/m.7516 type:complete len:474 (-) Transcript_4375:15-1436(-)